MKKLLRASPILLLTTVLAAQSAVANTADPLPLTQLSLYGDDQGGRHSPNYNKGSVNLSPDGANLTLEGNLWRAVEVNYTITEDTVLEFDFSSTRRGEFQAIGFDNNVSMDEQPSQWFVLNGTHPWGNKDFYGDYTSGLQHYTIPVGEYAHLRGQQSFLTLINDDDANAAASSTFSNVRLYDVGTTPVCSGNLAELQTLPANSEFTVNCPFDLAGSSMALPVNTTLNYAEGGSISNGELFFSGGKIDGRLLNASLDIVETQRDNYL